VLYDNHSPKGHHRHVQGIEQEYAYSDVEQLPDRLSPTCDASQGTTDGQDTNNSDQVNR
jgi:hypothetical protein